MKAYGLDIDFAPVADVNTNPRNPVIGDRAFGDDPAVASGMVQAYIRGLHEGGTASCIKHFPGHGDTATDTHTGYAETKKTWEEISACEMVPFRAGIAAGTDFVMTAHIAAPSVTGTDEPSTMSYTVLTEKLRQEGYWDSGDDVNLWSDSKRARMRAYYQTSADNSQKKIDEITDYQNRRLYGKGIKD